MNKKTFELIDLLTKAIKTGNQELINIYAFELTTRIYVPNEQYTFEETLEGFGYRKLDPMVNQITIEEYLRSKENDEQDIERGRKRN